MTSERSASLVRLALQLNWIQSAKKFILAALNLFSHWVTVA